MSHDALSKTSFCHCFENEGAWFAYDVATNNTYQIEPLIAAVLPLWGDLSAEEVAERLRGEYSRSAVLDAIADIKKARTEHGVFLPCYPIEIQSPVDRFNGFAPQISQMILTVSEQCNMRCVYCVHGDGFPAVRSHRDTYMSTDTALAAVRFFERFSPASVTTRRIGFFGGEALLGMDIIRDVVEYVDSRPMKDTVQFYVSTNGLLLNDPDTIEYLCRHKIIINVSLDGPKDHHDRYRKNRAGGGSYDSLMRGLRKLLVYDPSAVERLKFKCTMSPPYEYLRIANYFERFPLYRELGLPERAQVSLTYVDHSELNNPAFRVPAPETTRGIDEETTAYYIDSCVHDRREAIPSGLRSLYDARLSLYNGRDRRPMPEKVVTAGCCSPLSGEKIHVRSDGSITACEKMSDCAVIGSVFDGIDHSAVQSMIDDFHASVRDRCRTCWALRLCKICYTAMNSSYTGSARPNVPASVCAQTRKNTERTLKLFTSILVRNPKALDFLMETSGPLR